MYGRQQPVRRTNQLYKAILLWQISVPVFELVFLAWRIRGKVNGIRLPGNKNKIMYQAVTPRKHPHVDCKNNSRQSHV